MTATIGEAEDSARRMAALEESLAAAVARLNASELREQRLKRENAELRTLLHEAGLDPVEGQTDEAEGPLGSPIARIRSVRSMKSIPGDSPLAGSSAAAAAAALGPDDGEGVASLAVDIVTSEGKVPALLLASDDCLEFVELRARITPAEFVGIKSCNKGATPGWRRGARGQGLRGPSSASGRRGSGGLAAAMKQGERGWLWRLINPSPEVSGRSTPVSSSPPDDDGGSSNPLSPSASGGKPPIAPRTNSQTSQQPPGAGKGIGALARMSWNGVVSAAEWQNVPAAVSQAAAAAGGSSPMTPDEPPMARAPSASSLGAGDDIPRLGRSPSAGSMVSEPELEDPEMGAWDILWKAGGGRGALKSMTFWTTTETRAFIHQQVESWAETAEPSMASSDPGAPEPSVSAPMVEARPTLVRVSAPRLASARSDPLLEPPEHADAGQEGCEKPQEPELGSSGEVLPPVHMVEGKWIPSLQGKSDILSEHDIRCLCHQLPRRLHQAPWQLAYSTEKHGISLLTLFRNAAAHEFTLLVVGDGAGYTFGSFNTEPWKMRPHYFGTGESFVFQLRPHALAYHWKRKSKERNDFFQFATPDSIAVGGGGHFALWIDQDLAYGNSGVSDAFGNAPLGSSREFRIKTIELWGIKG